MYKMIVSDLDETLVHPDGSVSQADIAAIKAAADAGVLFVPNTGRSFDSIQGLLQTLGTYEQAGQYVISYNGGAVVENRGNKVLMTGEMPFAQAQALFDFVSGIEEIDVHIYTLHHLYVYRPRADDLEYMDTRNLQFGVMPDADFTRYADKHIMKIIIMNPEEAVRHAVADQVRDRFGDAVNISFSSGRYAEFNYQGVDKGTAAVRLAASLGIKPDEIMALGDNANDLPMFAAVGMPVAVANAIPAAKAAAKYVTDADYTAGVAEAINKFILTQD